MPGRYERPGLNGERALNQIHELLQIGDLSASLAAAMESVRANAADVRQRIALFQLYCLTGEWEKARRQLYVLKDMDASTIPMFEAYDPVLQCEMFRSAVFDGQRSPLFFGEPRDWLATLSSALVEDAAGRKAAADSLRDQAFDAAPPSNGSVDGESFEWIADADGRLGPVLEVYLRGRYYWVPFEHISVIDTDKPEDLRDLVWTPARFQWTNGGDAVGFIPTRYPGTEAAADDRLRLSRMTEWIDGDDSEHAPRGLGQRLLATDRAEYPLLGIRSIRIGAAAEQVNAAAEES
ncbi:MAG: virulence protein SciE type [Gammaproteobacteria bacterium HGW-Gammaproteobacteria-8]|nr:MAG: virulence protein SciE type [Gammaproteobacteria bacterium HGW-Gammaproteobacteria-8]